jgi:hypothetical protein
MTYKSVLITLTVFAFCHSAKSQRVVPSKGDNIIVITGDTSASKNLDNFGRHLIDKGYSFLSIDRIFNTITTEERTSEGEYRHKLHIYCKDSTIIVRVTCNKRKTESSVVNYIWEDWQYGKYYFDMDNFHYRAFMPVISSFNKPFLFYQRP